LWIANRLEACEGGSIFEIEADVDVIAFYEEFNMSTLREWLVPIRLLNTFPKRLLSDDQVRRLLTGIESKYSRNETGKSSRPFWDLLETCQ
jgi:hypothetical protein